MEAPLFKNGNNDSKQNIGIVCSSKHSLEEKIQGVSHITDEQRKCLHEIHQSTNFALKTLKSSKHPPSPLVKELHSLRRVVNRAFKELGTPKLLKTDEAKKLLNIDGPFFDRMDQVSEAELLAQKGLASFTKHDDKTDEQEFAEINSLSHVKLTDSGKFTLTLARGKSKNRHEHTIPFMYNQVGGRGHEDYVNASLITFNEMSFIAAQGPMRRYGKKNGELRDDTVPDFINMLKVGSNTIITLTNSAEGDKEKCVPWWTEEVLNQYTDTEKHPQVWGHTFSFEFKSSKLIDTPENTRKQSLKKRRFTLKWGQETRVVTQFHMKNWLDGDLPDLGVLECLIKKVMHHPIEGPLIVHCSSGVGRTGTFILAYKNYKYVHEKLQEGVRPEDIKVNYLYDTVLLRTQRMKMVGTEDQYKAVKAVVRRLQSKLSPS